MSSETRQNVANRNDLKEGSLLKVKVNCKTIALSIVNGKVYAMDAICSHEAGSLEEGTLEAYKTVHNYVVLLMIGGKKVNGRLC